MFMNGWRLLLDYLSFLMLVRELGFELSLRARPHKAQQSVPHAAGAI